MRYLVDTNVISELCKERTDPKVEKWLLAHDDALFLSVITIEEMRFGELMMPHGKRRRQLRTILDSLFNDYGSRILPFDAPAASQCAVFHEKAVHDGRTPTFEDLAIAAIAKVNGLLVATRNIRDFDYLDVGVVNPFEGE